MLNPLDTVISQYANSPTLRQLVLNMNEHIDPSTNFADFYEYVWNVDTAKGFGLDVWGKIVNVSRYLTIEDIIPHFGFASAVSEGGLATLAYLAPPTSGMYSFLAPASMSVPIVFNDILGFDQAVFFGEDLATNTYRLDDDVYRLLVLTKALANISLSTPASINQLLRNLFAGRGRCYVSDLGGMKMAYVFEFLLRPFELAVLLQSGIIPRPAGVSSSIIQVAPETFGFLEAGGKPFGEGVFLLFNRGLK
jgi:hypothetical protein